MVKAKTKTRAATRKRKLYDISGYEEEVPVSGKRASLDSVEEEEKESMPVLRG